ncbi:MAG: LCP family protein [Chloroflexi bacterium]|nr:LCP family protein [Chloroflexota bacterium]
MLFFLPACGINQAGQPTSLPTVTLPLNPTPSLTPFLPDGEGSLSIPTRPFPTLAVLPISTETPPPAELIPLPAGQVSILLLGSDQRPGRSDFRTDVVVLMILRADGAVSLVSFPRDLYVYLPGRSMSRINAAYEYGGFELFAQTLDYNFGLRPDHFILTNFSGFMAIVDSLGGVDVNVGQALSDARTGYPDGFTVYAGIVHMDGETALWYIRSRATSNDFDRLRRAQEVLVAIGQKLLTLQGLAHIPELYQAYQGTVVTDLSVDGLLAFLPLLQGADVNRVSRYAIAPPLVTPWIEPYTGSYYLLPDPLAIRAILQQAVGIP